METAFGGIWTHDLSPKHIPDNARKTAGKNRVKEPPVSHSTGRKTAAEPEGRSGLGFAFQKDLLGNIFLPGFCFVWRKNGVSYPVQKPCT